MLSAIALTCIDEFPSQIMKRDAAADSIPLRSITEILCPFFSWIPSIINFSKLLVTVIKQLNIWNVKISAFEGKGNEKIDYFQFCLCRIKSILHI